MSFSSCFKSKCFVQLSQALDNSNSGIKYKNDFALNCDREDCGHIIPEHQENSIRYSALNFMF